MFRERVAKCNRLHETAGCIAEQNDADTQNGIAARPLPVEYDAERERPAVSISEGVKRDETIERSRRRMCWRDLRGGGGRAGACSRRARRSGRPARAAVRLAGGERRREGRFPHLRAPGARDPAGGRRHSRRRAERAAHKADNGVWELTHRSRRLRRLPLQLQRRRRGDDRSAQPVRSASRTTTSGAWSTCRARICSTRRTCRTARSPRSRTSRPTLGRVRRMHVYTPPGYENGRDRYPGVLSAARRRRQRRLLVDRRPGRLHPRQPDGHAEGAADDCRDARGARRARYRQRRSAAARPSSSSATSSIDVMPYVEKHYRVLTDRANTAIAGLSMGGGQTLRGGDSASGALCLHRRLQLRADWRVSHAVDAAAARRRPRHSAGRPVEWEKRECSEARRREIEARAAAALVWDRQGGLPDVDDQGDA